MWQIVHLMTNGNLKLNRKFLSIRSKKNFKDLNLDKEIEESEIVRCIKKL